MLFATVWEGLQSVPLALFNGDAEFVRCISARSGLADLVRLTDSNLCRVYSVKESAHFTEKESSAR